METILNVKEKKDIELVGPREAKFCARINSGIFIIYMYMLYKHASFNAADKLNQFSLTKRSQPQRNARIFMLVSMVHIN